MTLNLRPRTQFNQRPEHHNLSRETVSLYEEVLTEARKDPNKALDLLMDYVALRKLSEAEANFCFNRMAVITAGR